MANGVGRAFAAYNAAMNLELVFLARLRERFGVARERLLWDGEGERVADLLAALRMRGGAFAVELAPERSWRVAVNHEVVDLDHVLADGDEVAIFPPVTGG